MPKIKVKNPNYSEGDEKWLDIAFYSNQSSVQGVEEAPNTGKDYVRRNSDWVIQKKIYEELDMTKERFSELLNRQYVIPTLDFIPSEHTTQWVDESETVNFRIGDFVRVADPESDFGYSFYRLYDITSDGKAVWNEQGTGGSSGETLVLTLYSNQGDNDNTSLYGATVRVFDLTQSQEILNTSWLGEPIIVEDILPQSNYSITVGNIKGYTTPEVETYIAVAGAKRKVNLEYKTCLVTISCNTNQSSHSDVANAQLTYSGGLGTYKQGNTVKCPIGQQLTISAGAITRYKTPANITITPTDLTYSTIMQYQTTLVTVKAVSNQGGSYNNDVAAVKVTLTHNGITDTVTQGTSVKVTTGSSVSASFSSASYYQTASSISFTASGTSITKTGTYNTCIMTVYRSGSYSSIPFYYDIGSGTIIQGNTTSSTIIFKIAYGGYLNKYWKGTDCIGYYDSLYYTRLQADSPTKSISYSVNTWSLPTSENQFAVFYLDSSNNTVTYKNIEYYYNVPTSGTFLICNSSGHWLDTNLNLVQIPLNQRYIPSKIYNFLNGLEQIIFLLVPLYVPLHF